jgi:hypothetical protein
MSKKIVWVFLVSLLACSKAPVDAPVSTVKSELSLAREFTLNTKLSIYCGLVTISDFARYLSGITLFNVDISGVSYPYQIYVNADCEECTVRDVIKKLESQHRGLSCVPGDLSIKIITFP